MSERIRQTISELSEVAWDGHPHPANLMFRLFVVYNRAKEHRDTGSEDDGFALDRAIKEVLEIADA
jgi:hypothetical protein